MKNVTVKPKHLLALLVLVVVGYAGVRWFEAGGREHVTTIPPGFLSMPAVREDRIISAFRDEDGLTTIQSKPLAENKPRIVLRDPAGGRVLGVAGGQIYYLVTHDIAADIPLTPDEIKSLTVRPERASAVRASGKPVTTRRRPAQSAPGVVRSVHVRQSTLKSIPVDGGPGKDLCADISGDEAAIAGNTLFWIEQGLNADWTRDDMSAAEAGGIPSRPIRVFAEPLSGGQPRPVLEAAGRLSLRPSGDGGLFVYARQGRTAPQGDLHFLRADGTRLGTLAGFPAGASTPVELKGRLYWVEGAGSGGGGRGGQGAGRAQPSQPELFSAGTDGSDRKSVLKFPVGRKLGTFTDITSARGGPPLRLHNGKLYVVLDPEISTGGGRVRAVTAGKALFTIQPDSNKPLQEAAQLPPSVTVGLFDGNFFYFSANEQRESWFSFSGDDLAIKNTNELYRIRLPN